MAKGLVEAARNGDKGAERLIAMVAAGGALHAQRDLLSLHIGDPEHPEKGKLHELSFAGAVRGETLARFCAFNGDSRDVRRLAYVLHQMAATTSNAEDRMAFAIEASGLLRRLADEGDGLASDFLAKIVAEFPEVRPGLALADAAILPAPASPIRTSAANAPTLGEILAEVFAQQPDTRSGLERARNYLAGLVWRIRFRLSALGER